MTKSIKLVTNFETLEQKEFFQPNHIKGSVALEALTIGVKIDKKGDDLEIKDIEEVAAFVTNKVYNSAFTVDEMIDGIHAPLLFKEVLTQLKSVINGDDAGNATKAKKN